MALQQGMSQFGAGLGKFMAGFRDRAIENNTADTYQRLAEALMAQQSGGGAPVPAPVQTPVQRVAAAAANPGTQHPQPGSGMSTFKNSIGTIESGNKYDKLGPVTKTGDRAYGKYQVMGNNIPSWTQEALGQRLTPQQFLASPQAQEAVFEKKFGSYVQKYGPEGAAKAWFAGERGMNNPNARDILGTTVANYAKKFNAGMGSAPSEQAAMPAAAQPAQGQRPPWMPSYAEMAQNPAYGSAPQKPADFVSTISSIAAAEGDDETSPLGGGQQMPGVQPANLPLDGGIPLAARPPQGHPLGASLAGGTPNEMMQQAQLAPAAFGAPPETESPNPVQAVAGALDPGARPTQGPATVPVPQANAGVARVASALAPMHAGSFAPDDVLGRAREMEAHGEAPAQASLPAGTSPAQGGPLAIIQNLIGLGARSPVVAVNDQARVAQAAGLPREVIQIAAGLPPAERAKFFGGIANKLAERSLAGPEKGTSDMQNYEFYVRDQTQRGLPVRPFEVWKNDSARAGAMSVTQNVGEGNEFYKTLDKGQAELYTTLQKSGMDARRSLGLVQRLGGMIGNIETGGAAALRQIAGNWGIKTEGLSDIQAAQALINQLVPAQRPAGSGPMSDADLELYKQSLPRLINQPGGNKLIIETMLGINQYVVKQSEIADMVADRVVSPAEGRKMLRELANPMEKFGERIASFGKGAGTPADGGGATKWERGPDGKPRPVKQ